MEKPEFFVTPGYGEYMFPMGNRTPIWTQVGVAALGLPTMRIEIRVTAIVPS
jgi:enamine deaminase RidA (YjgF/YER057c/UK114 family)